MTRAQPEQPIGPIRLTCTAHQRNGGECRRKAKGVRHVAGGYYTMCGIHLRARGVMVEVRPGRFRAAQP